MQGRVEWTSGTGMVGINASGQRIEMDWETGPSPSIGEWNCTTQMLEGRPCWASAEASALQRDS